MHQSRTLRPLGFPIEPVILVLIQHPTISWNVCNYQHYYLNIRHAGMQRGMLLLWAMLGIHMQLGGHSRSLQTGAHLLGAGVPVQECPPLQETLTGESIVKVPSWKICLCTVKQALGHRLHQGLQPAHVVHRACKQARILTPLTHYATTPPCPLN